MADAAGLKGDLAGGTFLKRMNPGVGNQVADNLTQWAGQTVDHLMAVAVDLDADCRASELGCLQGHKFVQELVQVEAPAPFAGLVNGDLLEILNDITRPPQ